MYSAIVILGGLGLLVINPAALRFVAIAVLAASPFACIQIAMVVRSHARDAITEICAAIALGVTAPAIVMLQGWLPIAAFALWLIPMLRAVGSISYVRTRLRRSRSLAVSKAFPLALQLFAVVITTIMVIGNLLPIGSIVAMLLLLLRAAYGLYMARLDTPARVIGFQEIAFGFVAILLVVVSYRL